MGEAAGSNPARSMNGLMMEFRFNNNQTFLRSMLPINSPKPSREEACRETKKRLKIVHELEPKLSRFSDAVLIVGSLAYSRDYCVRESSDIDLLVLVTPEYAHKILTSDLFDDRGWNGFG